MLLFVVVGNKIIFRRQKTCSIIEARGQKAGCWFLPERDPTVRYIAFCDTNSRLPPPRLKYGVTYKKGFGAFQLIETLCYD